MAVFIELILENGAVVLLSSNAILSVHKISGTNESLILYSELHPNKGKTITVKNSYADIKSQLSAGSK